MTGLGSEYLLLVCILSVRLLIFLGRCIDVMRNCFYVLIASLFMLSAYQFPAYASLATPSDADISVPDDIFDSGSLIDDDLYLQYLEDTYDDLDDSETLKLILSNVMLINDSLSGPGVSTVSDAEKDSDLEMEVQEDVEILSLDNDISLYASLSLPDHDVIWIHGTFNSVNYTMVVPRDYYPYLYVAENGVLYNVSASNITCRLFKGSVFDSSDYEYDNFVLYPVLGNSANNLYRYDYLSYLQHYYRSNSSSSSLTSSTTYGNFYVKDIEIMRSLDVDYRLYYVSVVVLFLLGVIVLCFWKNYKR